MRCDSFRFTLRCLHLPAFSCYAMGSAFIALSTVARALQSAITMPGKCARIRKWGLSPPFCSAPGRLVVASGPVDVVRFDQILGFFQAQAGQQTRSFDHGDLLVALTAHDQFLDRFSLGFH